MNIVKTQRFSRSFSKIPSSIQQKARKQIELFLKNISHPSLHTEKLQPKEKNIWSFRINKSYRVIFTILPQETIVFLDIGSHAIYRKA